MWNRADLKQKAKAAFTKNYWPCVLVAFILTLVTAGAAGCATGGTRSNAINELSGARAFLDNLGLVLSASALFIALAVVLDLFVIEPLTVGGYHFFVKNSEAPAPTSLLGSVYKSGNFGKVFVTMLLKNVFLFLWSLLFIIPGIVKFYSYRMVPYLLAENPDMEPTAVITKSREMMKGHKWDVFVLDISFFLWYLLSAVTFGLVGIFYVFPYIQATDAELYLALKNK